MTSTVTKSAPVRIEDIEKKQAKTLILSSNWATLQKSLQPSSDSKKRKRNEDHKPRKSTKSPEAVQKKHLTAYNPWKPTAVPIRNQGNPALIISPHKSDDIKPGRYVGIDCEMVGYGPEGAEDMLARVSIVNYFGQVLLDAYVRPTARVTDWRTKYSGIRPADVLNPDGTQPDEVANIAQSFDEVQKKVKELISGRILIGHSLQGDLTVLKLVHPKQKIRDTALYEPFRTKYSSGKAPALKKVVEAELNVRVQHGEHDSIEDAQAAMALYRHVRGEFEKAVRMGHLKGIKPKETPTPAVEPTPSVISETPHQITISQNKPIPQHHQRNQ